MLSTANMKTLEAVQWIQLQQNCTSDEFKEFLLLQKVIFFLKGTLLEAAWPSSVELAATVIVRFVIS